MSDLRLHVRTARLQLRSSIFRLIAGAMNEEMHFLDANLKYIGLTGLPKTRQTNASERILVGRYLKMIAPFLDHDQIEYAKLVDQKFYSDFKLNKF